MSAPIRVLLAVSSGRIGGAEHHTHLLARALRDREGWAAEVACRPGPLVARLEGEGIPVHPMAFGDGIDLVTPLRLAGLGRDFDLLHAHMNRAAVYTRIASWFCRRPWVVTAHGMTRGVYYRGADRVIAVSAAVRRHLEAQGISRVEAIWNGLPAPGEEDAGAGDALRARLGVGEGECLLLVLANRHVNKGQELAIEALAHLPARFRLLLSGNGVDCPELRERVAASGVGDRVTLSPPFDGTTEPMEAADVLLVPSFREAFSLVAAEARMRGRPVVASDVDGLVEVVADDAPGCRRVEGRDPAAWAAAIEAAADPGERAAAGDGAAAARELFALDRWIDETLPIYAEVSCGRRDSARTKP